MKALHSTRGRKPRQTSTGILQLLALEDRTVPAAIRITEVPAYGGAGLLRGVVSVSDVENFSQFRVAPFIQIEGLGWFTKPTFAAPTVPINADGTFAVNVFTGGIDNRATIFAAALVPANVTPPSASGAPRLPANLNPVAIDTRERFGRTFEFAGHTWGVKESPVDVGPGSNRFSSSTDDVFVDGSGLHLRLSFRDGAWQSSEVVMLDTPGYGTYAFQTTTDMNALDANAVFGAFTYDPYGDETNGAETHREFDFEDSRFGNAADSMNAQTVVQPFATPGNLHRYTITTPPGNPSLTRFFTWTPERIDFTALRGLHTPADFAPADVIDQVSYLHDPAANHFVPTPGRAHFRFNLWLFDTASAPLSGQPQEVIIRDFTSPHAKFAVGMDVGGASAVLANADGTVQRTVTPFEAGFAGGVRVATGDVTGDGIADLVTASGPGRNGTVIVVDDATGAMLFTLIPFGNFTRGVVVTTGDLTGDGKAEIIISAEAGGGARIRIFSNDKGAFEQLSDFIGLIDGNGLPDVTFRGGARTAVGDINGDGRGDLVFAAGAGGGPRIALFDGKSLGFNGGLKIGGDFFAFEPELRNGTYVAAGDIDGDGRAELIAGAGPGGGPRVALFSGAALIADQRTKLQDFFAGDVNNRGGIRVAAKFLDRDSKTDLVVGAGGVSSRVTAYSAQQLLINPPMPHIDYFAFPGFNGGVFVG